MTKYVIPIEGDTDKEFGHKLQLQKICSPLDSDASGILNLKNRNLSLGAASSIEMITTLEQKQSIFIRRIYRLHIK